MLPGLDEARSAFLRYQIIERPLVPPKSIGELAIEEAQDSIARDAEYYGVRLSTMAKYKRMECDEIRRAMWHKERT